MYINFKREMSPMLRLGLMNGAREDLYKCCNFLKGPAQTLLLSYLAHEQIKFIELKPRPLCLETTCDMSASFVKVE